VEINASGESADVRGPANRSATIAYDLRKDWIGPLVHPGQFHPVLMPEYVEFTGNNALVFPQLKTSADQSATVTAQFDFQQLPASWTLATSFGTATAEGDRCQAATVPAIDVVHALFTAGDFRLRPFRIDGQPQCSPFEARGRSLTRMPSDSCRRSSAWSAGSGTTISSRIFSSR
jgi:hypothetical protein